MAKTVDELVVKITAEGTAQITEATKAMDTLGATSTKTGDTLKNGTGNIRNVAFQVQDMAVQIAGGTSAFVAMGQQLPQLLGGFGMWGAVIGAVAAIGIPLLRAGLQAAGVDMRNLDERTTALTESVKKYQEAQRANLPTLEGLGNTYGTLTGTAKEFFDIQQKLTEQKIKVDVNAALKELKDNYKSLTEEAQKAAVQQGNAMMGMQNGAPAIQSLINIYKAWRLDLTAEQAQHVAESLKNIDKASPEQAIKTLTEVSKYLEEAGVSGGKLKKFFDETVEPILKLNNQLIETTKNLKESGDQASRLSVEIIDLQRKAQPDINAARRNFDQYTAVRKEGELKYAELQLQLREKVQKGTMTDAQAQLEAAANYMKINQDTGDKVKDIAKSQFESYKTSLLGVDAKRAQLQLESDILKIQDKGRYDLPFNVKFEEDIVRIQKEHADTLISIGEQRRKNVVTSAQANQLEKEAASIQAQGTKNAEQARANAVKAFVETQAMDNMKKSIEEQIALSQKLGDTLVAANKKGFESRDAVPASQLVGLSSIQKQIVDIQEQARKSALAAKEAFAAAFTAREDGMTPEDAAKLAEGIDKIDAAWGRVVETQTEVLKSNHAITTSFDTGVKDAWASFVENSKDSAAQAKSSFSNFTTGLEDAFVKLATTGKLSFSDLANSIIADLARIAVRKAIVGIGSFFGLPGLAGGGPVTPNQPYIVGEKGPELFLPSSAGNIVPNNALSTGGKSGVGGQTVVNYNIQAVDAQSFRSMVARDPSFIYAVTEQGRRSQPTRRAM